MEFGGHACSEKANGAMKFAYLALYLAAGFGGFFLPDLVSEKARANAWGRRRSLGPRSGEEQWRFLLMYYEDTDTFVYILYTCIIIVMITIRYISSIVIAIYSNNHSDNDNNDNNNNGNNHDYTSSSSHNSNDDI